ncbi:MAG: MoaD/ThiS family protein [Elusimicrobia bacterium]|nr:MoaD/ThiS family protein [Elusimicrobiota bacterium]
MTRTIELYGRLRGAGLGDRVELELRAGLTAGEALGVLKAVFRERAGLLEGCALATENSVLRSADPLPDSARLAALPPVCGG